MESETFVGLDVHKSTVAATAVDASGTRISQRELPPSDAALQRYLESLPGKKRVVLEACPTWEHYFDAAIATGAEVVLSHPKQTKAISKAKLKTDRVDSEILADLIRRDAVPTAFAPPLEWRELRRLVQERLFYLKHERGVRNHIYAVLLRKGIPYEDRLLGLKRKREQLRRLGLPELDRGLDTMVFLEGRTHELDLLLHERFQNCPEAQLLESIPGVGELTALALVAYLCPIDRFDNVDQVSAYAGLCPAVIQSGGRSYHGSLIRDCNPLLRWVLIEASWATRRVEKRGEVARLGRRIARRKGQTRAAVSCAHKLLKISYAVLRRGTPYEPHAPGSSSRCALAVAS